MPAASRFHFPTFSISWAEKHRAIMVPMMNMLTASPALLPEAWKRSAAKSAMITMSR